MQTMDKADSIKSLKNFSFSTVFHIDESICELSQCKSAGELPKLYKTLIKSPDLFINEVSHFQRRKLQIGIAFAMIGLASIFIAANDSRYLSNFSIEPIFFFFFIELVMYAMPAIAVVFIFASLMFCAQYFSISQIKQNALKNASSVVDLEALQNYLLSNKQVNAKFSEINFNDNINAAHIAYLYRIEILIQQKLLNATQDFDRKLNKMVEDEILDAIKISRTQ